MELRCQQISVNQSEPLESKYQAAPKKFIFNEENKTSFLEAQKTDSSRETLSKLNCSITSILTTNLHNQNTLSEYVNNVN